MSIYLVEEIILHEEFCVKFCAEGKIYLNEDRIFPTANGMYLALDRQATFVLIPEIFSDASGCYIRVDVKRIESLNRCRYCDQKYFVICRNPDCSE